MAELHPILITILESIYNTTKKDWDTFLSKEYFKNNNIEDKLTKEYNNAN